MGPTFDLYIPVVTARLMCRSRLLDNMGEFTKFILWNIGSGNSLEDVDVVMGLDRDIIDDEVDYLVTHKLLEGDGKTLTALGREYFQLILCMEALSEKGIPAIIDLHSGNVSLETAPVALCSPDDIPKGSVVLKERISRLLFRNDDYGNSKDVTLKYLADKSSLEPRHMRSVYTTLKLNGDHGENTRYAVRAISLYSADAAPGTEDKGGSRATVGVPVSTYRLACRDRKLDPYRPLLEQLRSIYEADRGLLSIKAGHIIALDKRESQIPELSVVIDRFSGRRFTRDPGLLVDRDKAGVPVLPSRMPLLEFGQKNIRYEQTGVDDSKVFRAEFNYEQFPYKTAEKSGDGEV